MKKGIYAVLTHYIRPKNSYDSNTKGWMADDSKMGYDEEFSIVTKVNNTVLGRATVILDLIEGKVIKSSLGNKDYAHFVEYARRHYGQQIDQAFAYQGIEFKEVTTGEPVQRTEEEKV